MSIQQPRPTVHEWAFSTAEAYAARGTCGRRKAGAVALDERNRVVGIGMNGVPTGFVHCIDKPCGGRDDPPGNTDNCLAIHAEANMIINAISTDRIVKVYVTTSPCKNCALLLSNLPRIREVYFKELYADARGIRLLHTRGIRSYLVEPSSSSPRLAPVEVFEGEPQKIGIGGSEEQPSRSPSGDAQI